ncbi:MAG TPA: FAD-dependent oxidoreductase [Candidatus Limnocylindrales bacterium]
MRVAVVGGGLFGSLAAVELARAGVAVTLYERHGDLLMGATRANQGRIHRGYHYPRDPAAGGLAEHADRLVARLPGAVVQGNTHHYLIADGSLVDAVRYEQFCRAAGLPWQPSPSSLVLGDPVTVRAPEAFLDVDRARTILRRELLAAGVRVLVGASGRTAADVDALTWHYDRVVDTTYGRYWPGPLRYEVCETALIELGPRYRGQSFVVMDGPYVSLDPHGPAHMLYDVRHSVHAVSETPEAVPEYLAPLLDRGLVRTDHTHLPDMLATARRFLSLPDRPTYLGSLFTVRAVLPDDGTDARPTLIRTDGAVTRVLAGKLCTAPWAAEQVARQLAPVPVG